MVPRFLIGSLAALTLACAASQATADCKFDRLVEVPVTMDGLRGTVATKINGHDATFGIDTGAFFSVVATEAVAQFGMKKSAVPFGMTVRGIGGGERDAEAAIAENFTFAGAGFKDIEFLAGGRFSSNGSVGVIGQNLMGPFDMEYDFANGAMRFFKAHDCSKANLAYWSSGMALSRVPLDSPGRFMQAIIAKAKVNGREIRVQLDSGAPVSYLSRRAAARAGIEISTQGVTNAGITYGAYGKGIETFLAPFQSFKIGDEEIKNTSLRIADIDLGNDTDMLLGADFFLSHRILISNSQKALYFTYNGGPVFRLDRPPAGKTEAQAAAPAPTANTAAAGSTSPGSDAAKPAVGLKTAAEFARRGAASAARRDFPAAIADYSRAIELEPQNGEHYHARATARLSNRQPLLALADLDQALKYNPGDEQALMLRGELYLQAHNATKAKADFDAVQKIAPGRSDLPAMIGVAYARAGLFDLGIQYLDGWIAAHPRDENLSRVYGARCWARAAANKDLDKALADCDLATRRDHNSQIMTYRGLVLYRMGRTDEAVLQYGAAIRAQPLAAQALYLRGLAELKKGDKAAGDADLAAAKAIDPNLTQEFRRFGLTPETGPATDGPKPAAG
ncbi:MAG TPA: aspartyl protease family protein [Phenylobacterium sp.]|jgi:tetratricopeptide (TPR) repeat protein